MTRTITIKEIEAMTKQGVSTFSKKDDSPRGCTTVSASQINVGDKIVIDNRFKMVIE